MNRHRNRPSSLTVKRARRSRPMQAVMMLSPTPGPTASPTAEASALALLSEILLGDEAWTMAEVQRLISMREAAERGRWSAAGLDEAGPSAR